MAEFTVEGVVVSDWGQHSLGVRADDARGLRTFWQEQAIDTLLFEKPEGPVLSIRRKRDTASCTLGDRVRLRFRVVDRSSGKRGIRTVGFSPLSTSLS